jgi:ribonuclease J
MVRIRCYGGLNEIGGNKFFIDFKKGSVLLDFGQTYRGEGYYFEEFLQPRSSSKLQDLLQLGLLPKLNNIYRQDAMKPNNFDKHAFTGKNLWETGLKSYEKAIETGEKVPDGVFISHSHADHCGYLPYLGDFPVYSSETSWKLMKAISDVGNLTGFDAQLTEMRPRRIEKLKGGYFPGELKSEYEKPGLIRECKHLENESEITTDNEISITGFDVDHSLPGSMACLIEADGKQILYTGDLRFHGRSGTDLGEKLRGLKPDAMICEGTRIREMEPDDEYQVEEDLTDLIENSLGLVMVGFAWKDLDRYETVKKAALNNGRIPVFDPRLSYTLARLDRCIYDEEASTFLERTNSMLYSKGDYTNSKHKIGLIPCDEWDSKTKTCCTRHFDEGVKVTDLRSDPDQYVLHMDYFRFKNLLDIQPPPGSLYVRAQCEPFNLRMEISEEKMKKWLRHFKINPNNNYEPIQIHASGHASGTEIKQMIKKIKPGTLIPVHTEHPDEFKNRDGHIKIPNYCKPIYLT